MRTIIAVLLLSILGFIILSSLVKTTSKDVEIVQRTEMIAELAEESEGVRFLGENPFTREYGKLNGDIKRDLEALRDVVINCQSLMKNFDTFHLPGNPEIVKFLQGENPENLAWIPAQHPLIKPNIGLLDRNGNPVFFHRLSGLQIEYRSAGADGEHWTDDDIAVR
ncbi:MAG TPA: hypothetical protein DIS80_06615 [Verrucomicrobiales bacterium]|nr:hypothetical protein [Verrucomicrobiales bacterium]